MLKHLTFVLLFVLGCAAIFYLFGVAFFATSYGGTRGILIRMVIVGIVPAFAFAMLPSIIWPTWWRMWILAYPLATVGWASLMFLSAFGSDGPAAFIVWSGYGLAMLGSSFSGGWVGQYVGNRRQRSRSGLPCHNCGYDLRGTVDHRCPECGAATEDLTHSGR